MNGLKNDGAAAFDVGVNVAQKSSNGHFVKNAKKVVMVDETKETFNVHLKEGQEAALVTNNHGTITIKDEGTVFHQNDFNPFTEMISKRLD